MTTRNVPDTTAAVLSDIEGERLRQIRQEGWTTTHDDEHELGEMAMAAASYAQKSTEDYAKYPNMIPPDNWPWSEEWWKPKSPRRDLIRAAALLVAEIERLDRACDSCGQLYPKHDPGCEGTHVLDEKPAEWKCPFPNQEQTTGPVLEKSSMETDKWIEIEDTYLTNQPTISDGWGKKARRIPDPDVEPTEMYLFCYDCRRTKRGVSRKRHLKTLRGYNADDLEQKLMDLIARERAILVKVDHPRQYIAARAEPNPLLERVGNRE